MILSPVLLFVYNRPQHTRTTLDFLSKNPEASNTHLFIFSDGSSNDSNIDLVSAVRNIIKQEDRFFKTTVINRSSNLGLAKSILTGIDFVFQTYSSLIVLEDDILTSPYFLQFMNNALVAYEDEPSVASVGAFVPPGKGSLPSTYFLRGAECWGWGVWRRSWVHFEPSATKLLHQVDKLRLRRELDWSYHQNIYDILHASSKNYNSSWWVRWHTSLFLKNLYTVWPSHSLTQNIGFDGTGFHSKGSINQPPFASFCPIILEQPIRELPRVRQIMINRSPSRLIYFFRSFSYFFRFFIKQLNPSS